MTLTAAPGVQNSFQGWTGGGCTGTGDCQVTMNQNTQVRPNFLATRYPVTILGAGNGLGTIREEVGRAFGTPIIECAIDNGVTLTPQQCAATVAYGSTIELGFLTNITGTNVFAGFSPECTPFTGALFPCRATITGPTTITATILAKEIRVRSAGGTGTGAVTTTTGDDINCFITGSSQSQTCTKIFSSEQPRAIILIARPAEGSRFVGWSGACTADPCTVFPDYPSNVSDAMARFEALPENMFKLVVNSLGGYGRGHVTSSPSGIDCDFSDEKTSGTGTCLAIFPFGTTVELTAEPRDGTKVLGFTRDCPSQSATCQVIMYHDRTATVQLEPARFAITVTATGNGSGGVFDVANFSSLLTPPINCRVIRGVEVTGTLCAFMYPLRSTLQLSAITSGSSKVTVDQTTCVTSVCTVTRHRVGNGAVHARRHRVHAAGRQLQRELRDVVPDRHEPNADAGAGGW